jgi:hypothetical protein
MDKAIGGAIQQHRLKEFGRRVVCTVARDAVRIKQDGVVSNFVSVGRGTWVTVVGMEWGCWDR